MFKATMRCAWIDKRRQSQLSNMPQALYRRRVDYMPFVTGHSYELMDRITKLVQVLRHVRVPPCPVGAVRTTGYDNWANPSPRRAGSVMFECTRPRTSVRT